MCHLAKSKLYYTFKCTKVTQRSLTSTYLIYQSEMWTGILMMSRGMRRSELLVVSRRLWWPLNVESLHRRNTAAARLFNSHWWTAQNAATTETGKSERQQSHSSTTELHTENVCDARSLSWIICVCVCDTACITENGEKMWGWDAETFNLEMNSFIFHIWKDVWTSRGNKECKGHSGRLIVYTCDLWMTFKESACG